MTIILTAIGVIILFSLAVFIHELGHFLAAKLLGFRVDAFSIGFGPAIWKKTVNGCEYRISSIPLGGYVAIPQLDPSSMDSIQGKHKENSVSGIQNSESSTTQLSTLNSQNSVELPSVPAWKRIIVAVAGPFGNVFLAVILAFIIGTFAPDDEFGGYEAVVGSIAEDSGMAKSGIAVGDRIVEVNGEKISFWHDLVLECHLKGNTNSGLNVVVAPARNPAELRAVTLPVTRDEKTGYYMLKGIAPRQKTQITTVLSDSPASNAGILSGDMVESIGGIKPASPTDAVALIGAQGTNDFEIILRRKGIQEPISLNLNAVYNEEEGRPLIGVSFQDPAAGIPQWMLYKRPGQQLSGDAKAIVRVLRALFAPKAKGESGRAAKDMGGPGTLLFMLWNEVQAGIYHSMAFLRFLCINLAILNLLPFPVLDGGHVLFALIEIITRRKPSQKVTEWITNIFAYLLISLMVILLFRDVVRIHKFTKRNAPAAEEAGK